MANEKLEDLLNLSLASTPAQRELSQELSVGFTPSTRTWELIVKYHGSLASLAGTPIVAEELIAGYAIITLPEELIPQLADMEQIEYVEMPKRLFFSVLEGSRASCIPPLTLRPPYLSGEGVLTAVIDSGIDYQNPDFRHADGTTRIRALWDQTLAPDAEKGFLPPEGFALGVEFTEADLNEALALPTQAQTLERVPSLDRSGHGTAVTGIAAGNGTLSGGTYQGIAPESELLIVKLGNLLPDAFPRTTELMRALTYAVRKSIQWSRPLAVNLSFGNSYGPHDGTSLLERFMDNLSEMGRCAICVGSGNEGTAAGHAAGRIQDRPLIEWAVGEYQSSFSLQFWKDYSDQFQLTLISPSGARQPIDTSRTGRTVVRLDNTTVLLYIGTPSPYSVNQEIFFDFLPEDTYIAPGIWRLEMAGLKVVNGQYAMYLPSASVRSQGTVFFAPTPEITLTIPSTSRRVITVAAYDSTYEAYADFSGRGYLFTDRREGQLNVDTVKPDLCAPGVNILAPSITGEGYLPFTGTSFATPFVTGAAALLMEWGIVQGNDPFLYGEKLKSYLRRGARPLRGAAAYPNEKLGYGALCLADSLPL